MRRFFLIFGVLPVLLIVCVAVLKKPASAPTVTNAVVSTTTTTVTPKTFTETRTSTFVSSVPVNNAALASTPNVVSLGFRLPLGPLSTVTITDDRGEPAQLGSGTFSDDRQTMTVLLRQGTTGNISVSYQACGIDSVCETGSFGFSVQTPR